MAVTARPGYTTGSVTSADGTIIGYRQFGQGPGVILVHGGMQAAQNFTKLATALAGSCTVYVPDRRGRGLSGPHGEHYGLAAEAADIAALAQQTASRNVFGLSSGALVALRAALARPAIRRVAVYEPPLSVDHSVPLDWVARYDREVARGRLGPAAVTAIRGTQTAPAALRFTPRPVLDALFATLLRLPGAQASRDGHGEQVPLRALVPTMHYDAQLAAESEGTLPAYAALSAEVLLLGGSQSPAYLKTSLDALAGVLPGARRAELPGCDHLAPDNRGQPERVAAELRRFFTAR